VIFAWYPILFHSKEIFFVTVAAAKLKFKFFKVEFGSIGSIIEVCRIWSTGIDSGGKRLGTHLFVKVSRPGDSEVTFAVFESSCHLLLPV